MATTNESEFVARGKVKEVREGYVVFAPSNTNYELHLVPVGGKYDGPVNEVVDAQIRAKARKVYTVPAGGTFVTPIFGPTKIVQGRVRQATQDRLVLHAAVPFLIELPHDDNAIDLDDGAIAQGRMVNAVLLPGATFELAGKAVAR
jgi:hypothetical protein